MLLVDAIVIAQDKDLRRMDWDPDVVEESKSMGMGWSKGPGGLEIGTVHLYSGCYLQGAREWRAVAWGENR